MKPTIRLAIVVNKIHWQTLDAKVRELCDFFAPKLDLHVEVFHTEFENIPFTEWRPGEYGIYPQWYQTALRQWLDRDICLFVVSQEDWKGGAVRGWQRAASIKAIELSIATREDERIFLRGFDVGSAFYNIGRHEMLHALFLMTGQPDTTHYWYGEGKLEGALAELNFGTRSLLANLVVQFLILYEKVQQLIERETMKIPKKPYSQNFMQWASAIKQFEGWFKGSRSERNNNPGNLKFAGQKGATLGMNGFAKFDQYESGWAALLLQLQIAATGKSKVYRADMSLLDFFKIYAPSSDDNHPETYAEFVARMIGVPVTTKIRELLQ